MIVAIFEDNLLWSERLAKSVRALGHEARIVKEPEAAKGSAVAIVNLGSKTLPGAELIPLLKPLGVYTVGHAGHKEKDLLELGAESGCDRLATNSELTFKIEAILTEASQNSGSN